MQRREGRAYELGNGSKLARQQIRSLMTTDSRVILLEDDMDRSEAFQTSQDRKLDTILAWLITGAITFAFGSFGIAATIIITSKVGR